MRGTLHNGHHHGHDFSLFELYLLSKCWHFLVVLRLLGEIPNTLKTWFSLPAIGHVLQSTMFIRVAKCGKYEFQVLLTDRKLYCAVEPLPWACYFPQKVLHQHSSSANSFSLVPFWFLHGVHHYIQFGS